MKPVLPSADAIKGQAKTLRSRLADEGRIITHSEALETVAKSYGFRDWNTLFAALGNRPRAPVQLGQIVEGRYLQQPFMAEVVGVSELSEGRYEIDLQFDRAVDVVTFDSFSNFRSRVRAVVGPGGQSFDRTSDGTPHLRLDL